MIIETGIAPAQASNTTPSGAQQPVVDPNSELERKADEIRRRREEEDKRRAALREHRMRARGQKRAEDNYEISEKGSSDEDSPDRSHKRIPAWSTNWRERIQDQMEYDPDSIFGGKISNPDMFRIFGEDIRSKKTKRGSSGNWEKDRLTKREVEAYKKRVGQTKPFPLPGFDKVFTPAKTPKPAGAAVGTPSRAG